MTALKVLLTIAVFAWATWRVRSAWRRGDDGERS